MILGAGALFGLVCHVFFVPTFDGDPSRLTGFHGLALLALLFGSAYLCLHLRGSLQRLRFWGMLAIFAAMALATLHLSPASRSEVLAAWRRWSPLLASMIAAPLWRIAGDVRVVPVLALLVSAWALSRLGRGQVGEVAALFLLFEGRTFLVVEQASAEPVALGAFALALLFSVQPAKRVPQWLALGLALGVLASSGRYAPFLAAPLWLSIPRQCRARAGLVALALVLFGAAPFLLSDPRGLGRALTQALLPGPQPLEGLSWFAVWAQKAGPPPPWAPLAALLAAGAVLAAGLRARLSAAQAATVAAASSLALVLLNQQAFCNDHFLVSGLLCVAVAAHSRDPALETA